MNVETESELETNQRFEEWEDEHMGLKQTLLRGIYAHGYETPSPIQKQAILPMLAGRDVIAQAQSGTGKTGAFTIASLQLLDEQSPESQILVISPTRELSRQTCSVFSSISQSMADVKIKLLIGGTSAEGDREDLGNNRPQIVIGCPGRIHDMLRRRHLHPEKIHTLILDEADEMLSSGFKDQIYNIFQYLNSNIQVALFSATMPIELEALTNKFMRKPVQILVQKDMLTLQGIAQYYIALDCDEHKFMALKDLFSTINMTQCIIYCNSIRRTEDLFNAMVKDNYPVTCIHSNLTEQERATAYDDFKGGKSRVLIATDLFARGIDVQQVGVVVNFDLPKSIHIYIHRIGRSGRWGRKGVGINFVTKRDQQKLSEIQAYYGTQIDEMPVNFSDGIV
jgi:translation initiation factor 4A